MSELVHSFSSIFFHLLSRHHLPSCLPSVSFSFWQVFFSPWSINPGISHDSVLHFFIFLCALPPLMISKSQRFPVFISAIDLSSTLIHAYPSYFMLTEIQFSVSNWTHSLHTPLPPVFPISSDTTLFVHQLLNVYVHTLRKSHVQFYLKIVFGIMLLQIVVMAP